MVSGKQCGMVDSYAIMEIIIITKSAQQLKTKMSREEYLILEDWKEDKSMKLNMKLIMKLEIKNICFGNFAAGDGMSRGCKVQRYFGALGWGERLLY